MSRVVGPTNSSGSPVYSYLGCYHDNAPAGHLLPSQPYANSSNTNALCQTVALSKKYIFAGTEYQSECYAGNTPPPSLYKTDEVHCTYSCAGDVTQTCGGNGGYLSVYYDASRYTPGTDLAPTGGPITVNSTGNFNYIGCYSEATAGRALSGLARSKAVALPVKDTTTLALNTLMNATAATRSTLAPSISPVQISTSTVAQCFVVVTYRSTAAAQAGLICIS